MSWLDQQGICSLLPDTSIHFEDSREAKIERIEKIGCDVFVDDLFETFSHSGFPKKTEKYLFDPNHHHASVQNVKIVRDWEELNFLLE